VASSDATLLLGLLMFFALWTGIVGFINMSSSGDITLSDMSALAGGIPGQAISDVSAKSLFTTTDTNGTITAFSQDYTIVDGFDNNLTKPSPWLYTTWEQQDGIGYVCIATKLLSVTPSELDLYGLSAVSNVYDITYNIANSGTDDFYTSIYTEDGGGYYVRYSADGIERTRLSTAGMLGSTTTITDGGVSTFISYPNANKAQVVNTQYNVIDNTVDVYLDGNYVGRISNTPPASEPLVSSVISYGGVATYHTGLVVSSVQSKFVLKKLPGSEEFFSTVISFLGTIWTAIYTFGSIIGAAIGLSSQSAIPGSIWGVIGVPCIAVIIYLYLKLARGGG
jgi:hypothetical protein